MKIAEVYQFDPHRSLRNPACDLPSGHSRQKIWGQDDRKQPTAQAVGRTQRISKPPTSHTNRICTAVSFAPPGLLPTFLQTTHGLRRGLHSFAPSELGRCCFHAALPDLNFNQGICDIDHRLRIHVARRMGIAARRLRWTRPYTKRDS